MAALTPKIIRIVRTHLDLTQAQVARRSGVSTSLISAIERREKRLMPEVEQRIGDALAVSDDIVHEILLLHHRVTAANDGNDVHGTGDSEVDSTLLMKEEVKHHD
ncbi:helix-turn-helix protein [Heliophilum fasciatum]|uniref:Helix-turn-helix protein n=1 Tax=Heliophilum fasciatum TaxID=35700 RepID=A0A4R2RCX8_9FIRM|nr:helix-turn-helix protein [Heliophilum fasciatum]